MVKTILAALIVAFAAVGSAATAQTGPGTLGKIKAAKAINVAYSADSLPFSFAGPNNETSGTRSTFANGSSHRSAVRSANRT